MQPDDELSERRRAARVAGMVYLLVVLSGMFSIAYVPGQVTVRGDAAATLQRVAEHAMLYRWGILAGFICSTAFLLLPLALLRVFAEQDLRLTALMVALAAVSVPIAFANAFHRLDLLALSAAPATLTPPVTAGLAWQAIAGEANGILVSKIFWGLWLIPFGLLVLRSAVIPRTLGVLLVIGGVSYVVDVVCRTLIPEFRAFPIAGFVTMPASLAELSTCGWLLLGPIGSRRA
ncbi:MAG: DUF4386 domain-containing protein [Gemmatimonadaceae bacterium]|nr:DUF4386 domain-containing protein [Gemmatimonadaceae bacterium]